MSEGNPILHQNLHRVRERIHNAAETAGRSPADVTLIGVTKYVKPPQAAALKMAGCVDLGESRPQQLWTKAEQIPDTNWHLIGHLQRNKVRQTLPLVTLIHSVDNHRLLASLEREALEIDQRVDVLLEVNVSGDTSKHGLTEDELPRLLEKAAECSRLHVRGLMTMAAREGGPAVAQRNFSALRMLRAQFSDQVSPNIDLKELSMGMSGDFETAIAEGATMVRIGSLLWEGC